MPVSIAARPRLDRFEVKHEIATAGASLFELAKIVAPDMPDGFWAMGVAIIDDGAPIEVHAWAAVTPRDGQSVAFYASMRGGGRALQLIATVAIVAAQAFAMTIPGVGPFISAAIGLAGAFVIPMLAPKPKGGAGKSPKQLGEGGFTQNALSPYEQIATVLGERRVPAPYLAPPYVEFDGENLYGTAIIGLAGRHELRDPWADGTPIDALQSYMFEGDASDPAPQLYTKVIWQEDGAEFSRHNTETSGDRRWDLVHGSSDTDTETYDLPKFQYFRLGSVMPDRIKIDLRFTQGLCRTKNDLTGGVAFQIKFVKPGESDIYLPEMHAQADSQTPFRARIEIRIQEDDLSTVGVGPLWKEAYASTTAQDNKGYTAHSYYGSSNDAIHTDREDPNIAIIFADPATITQLKSGGWSLAIRQGSGYQVNRHDGAANEYAYNGGADVQAYWFDYHDLSTNRTLEDQAKVVSSCVIEKFTREWDVAPLNLEGIAYYEFKLQNPQISQVTVFARRYVKWRWNATASEWENYPHISRNPGELAYDVMRNNLAALNTRPLDSSIINSSELGELAAHCTTYGLECNAFISSGSVEEALGVIMQSAGAYLKRGQQWGCYIEKDRSGETPVQVFSPANSNEFTVEKVFDHKPHGLRVTFDDQYDDYQTRPEFVVYAPGYNADGSSGKTQATRFESLDLRGVTTEWQARYIANLELKKAYYRDKIYSILTDARWLVAPRGSLVGVSHYVLSSAHGFAAIREVLRQVVGGVTVITGLILDQEVDMQASTTGVAITTNSATIVTGTTTSGNGNKTREVIFATPLTDDTTIEEGCTCVFGAVSSEYIRCIVDNVEPGPNLTAKLTLVDEAPEIFA